MDGADGAASTVGVSLILYRMEWIWKFSPSNNHGLLRRLGDRTFDHWAALTSLDIGLSGTNIHPTVFLKDVELVQRIQRRGVLDVSSGDIKAGYPDISTIYHNCFSAGLNQSSRKIKHTSVPRTGNPPIRCNNTQLQRRPVMRAAGTESMHLAIILDNQHLSILDPLDLALALLERGDLREGGDIFQLVLVGHCDNRSCLVLVEARLIELVYFVLFRS